MVFIKIGKKGFYLSAPVLIAILVITLIIILLFIGQLSSRGTAYSEGFFGALKNLFAGI